MALIKCPECGREISDTAGWCPGCGYSIKKYVKQHKAQKKTLNKSAKFLILIGLLTILVTVTVGLVIANNRNRLPNFNGMDISEAKKLCADMEIGYEIKYDYTKDYSKDIVYDQSVTAGTKMKQDMKVILDVSRGKIYTVPEIVGKKYDDIKSELEGLEVKLSYEYSDKNEKGIVDSISKKEGTEIKENEELRVVVSKGLTMKVPDVIRKTKEEAIQILEDIGLKVIVKEEIRETEKGIVYDYTPKEYGEKGETITICVSKGGVNVPNVNALSLNAAKKLLEEKGFKVNITYQYDDMDYVNVTEESDYKIVDQSVKGLVETAGNITLFVSKPAVVITKLTWEVNSVGGVDTYITCKNVSDKQIAYINYDIQYYDRMGKKAECEIKHESRFTLTETGPLDPGKSTKNNHYWGAVLYNSTTAVVQPKTITVEFTDGSTQVIECDGRYWHSRDFYGGDLED